uniref:Peroxiredoxin-6 n=1 Tax=Phallusia mammillata TaxID=59560 RepID=A0A6F9DQ82_9ASCI|nr:peroxiredoxin-6-like [Phallusia mammillata]
MSAPQLGKVFPNFEAESTVGKIDFHKYIEGSWAILFSHPADYTPVCTTELGTAAKLEPEFKKRGVKMIGLSIDSVEDHKGWIKDIQDYNSVSCFPYPLIAADRPLVSKLGMLDPDEIGKDGLALTARCVFIVGPDQKLKLSLLYPATTGRNFDEILRVIDSLQLTANKKVATPANWQSGGDCMIIPSVSNDEAAQKFPGFKTAKVPSGKAYIRTTPHPK